MGHSCSSVARLRLLPFARTFDPDIRRDRPIPPHHATPHTTTPRPNPTPIGIPHTISRNTTRKYNAGNPDNNWKTTRGYDADNPDNNWEL
ncbi:MAG: hypothetical protein Q4D93_05815, partial [Porphyromonas sp.]|nr:hypothetical protein [Porphyromonas sp.]